MSKEILNKIKSRGYWQVNFYPTVFEKNKIPSLSQCYEILQKSVVKLRGWDYPHLPISSNEKQKIYNNNDCVESWIDWGCFKEFWRLYQSGQFIHFFSMIEDWYEEDSFFSQRQHIKPTETFDMIHNIYRVTEIYEFLRRLSRQGLYPEGLNIDIKICGIKNRRIVLDAPGRLPLFDMYISNIPEFLFTNNYYAQDLRDNAQEITLGVICKIFEQFNWNNPPVEAIKNDQKNLLERRF